MKVYNHRVELIINQPMAAKSAGGTSLKKSLEASGIPVHSIKTKAAKLPRPKGIQQKKSLAAAPAQYIKTSIRDTEMNPWDVAHLSAKALGPGGGFIEPDLLNEYVADANKDAAYKRNAAKGKANKNDTGYDPDWPPLRNSIWHLGDAFSQLKKARDSISGDNYLVRIGHIDTGYDATHSIVPLTAKHNRLQRNFVDGEDTTDAQDPRKEGPLLMPGHGTGTLGILAGNKIKINTDDGLFDDYLGAVPSAEVVCCRIASSVVLLKTSAFAEAVQYLTQLSSIGYPVHVISMSMGGAPSRAWAQAVNAAYEAGITMVTAAGNHFNGLPTTHVIYPARFGRVIAACGVTHDLYPYHSNKIGEMQGCYGPEQHMGKAMAAFTPNTPWASGSQSVIRFSGAGTSSATPQVAAAAALYYKKHHLELNTLPGWQRVEAIRYALYRSASKKANPYGSFKNCFGNGILKAYDALQVPVYRAKEKTPEDSVPWFPILTTLFKSAPTLRPSNRLLMFQTELAQLLYHHAELATLVGNETKPFDRVSKKQWRQLRDAVIAHPGASTALKNYLMTTT